MQQNDPVKYEIKRGEQLTLKKVGGKLVIFAGAGGMEETSIKIGKKDILVITGDGSGSKITIEAKSFNPHISIQTDDPLKIAGRFTADESSTQTALVEVTPVELTNMRISRSSKGGGRVKDPKTGKYNNIPGYKLSTTDSHLKQPKGELKTLRFKQGKGKILISVEGDARVDFINGKDGNEPLFSLDGSDDKKTTEMRFKRVRNQAMVDVEKVLTGSLAGGRFDRAKERMGINLDKKYTQGKVTIKSVGRVDIATTPYISDSLAFTQSGPVTGSPVNGTKNPEDQKRLDKIINRVHDYYGKPDDQGNISKDIPKKRQGHTYGMLHDGRLPRYLGARGPQNRAVQLGDAMKKARELAKEVYNPKTGTIRSNELAQLHQSLDDVDRFSGDIQETLKDFKKDGERNKRIDGIKKFVLNRARAINKQFAEFHEELNKSPVLKDNRNKKHGMAVPDPSLDAGGLEESLPAKAGLLDRLAKQAMGEREETMRLAVADVDDSPAVPASLPAATGGGNKTGGNRAA